MAARISAATGIEWHSVDDLTWMPDWVMVADDVQRDKIASICASPEWILDTAYGKWLDVVLPNVELVVALDYPRWFSLQRLIRRTLARALDGRLVCNGNRETLRNLFSSDSIVVWHFRSFHRKRARIRRWHADPAAPPVVRLTSASQARRWLAG